MKTARSYARSLVLIAAVICSAPTKAHENSEFSVGWAGTHPVFWKDYEPLQNSGFACLKDNDMQTGTCQEIQTRVVNVLSDAFLAAVIVNVSGPPSDKFCDDYATKLVKSKNLNQMAAYAMLLVEDRLKHGSSLYGDALPKTYVAKIVFDALLAQSPCHK